MSSAPPAGTERVDVAVVGGGHNALVAAAYLARAGLSVVVLERSTEFGGAAVSQSPFAGQDARISRYAYLVSLLPPRIIRDLGLDLRLIRRRVSSYTPVPGRDTGLLIDHGDAAATAESFARIGAASDRAGWDRLAEWTSRAGAAWFPTLTEPLLTRSEARRLLDDDAAFAALVERPIGETIDDLVAHDLVRGVLLTDGLIGTAAPVSDTELRSNRCFLYHVIGQGTGDWDVPVGGMGAVSGALERAARAAGARLLRGVEVESVSPDGEVAYREADGGIGRLAADRVLAGCSPTELASLLGEAPPADTAEGAQVKVNMLLRRLPRLRDADVDPRSAFSGTFHVNEGRDRLDAAYTEALAGRVPDPLPLEIYCHTLSDPSILGPELRDSGHHTLTVFGLQTPHRLAAGRDPGAYRDELERAVLRSLDAVLAEPISDVLARDADGAPCLETRTTVDLEQSLRLPGGNIFHGDLDWPFLDDDAPQSTAAQRWGVETAHERILLAGSGSRRGGAVSGLGGFSAAMAVLDEL